MDSDKLERAKLAMEEYKVLHAEILQRNSILIQVIVGCIGAIATIAGFAASDKLPYGFAIGLTITALAVMASVWMIVWSNSRKLSRRIIEIEEYVNDAVGGDDVMPLSWERRYGLLRREYKGKAKMICADSNG